MTTLHLRGGKGCSVKQTESEVGSILARRGVGCATSAREQETRTVKERGRGKRGKERGVTLYNISDFIMVSV